jgi:hypothetical protein
MGTTAPIAPNDGLKKILASVLIRKSCSELIDIHNIFSYFIGEDIIRPV